jgi:FkbM family methyltransferase
LTGGGYGEFSIECALKGALEIHAFEPNPIVYQYLQMNTKSFSQIKAINAGLWTDETDSLLYFRESGTASASIHEIQFAPTSSLGLERIKLRIKLLSIKKVIRDIQDSNEKVGIGLKLDIEGAEHQILDNLAGNGLLNNIDKIWIEYHYGHQELLNVLIKHFNQIEVEIKDSEMGLIKAFRR